MINSPNYTSALQPAQQNRRMSRLPRHERKKIFAPVVSFLHPSGTHSGRVVVKKGSLRAAAARQLPVFQDLQACDLKPYAPSLRCITSMRRRATESQRNPSYSRFRQCSLTQVVSTMRSPQPSQPLRRRAADDATVDPTRSQLTWRTIECRLLDTSPISALLKLRF